MNVGQTRYVMRMCGGRENVTILLRRGGGTIICQFRQEICMTQKLQRRMLLTNYKQIITGW